MIHAKHLTKAFGSRLAVDDLSFEVNQGDVVGFLGPNGAGKTTTLRMLTGYLPPTNGTATIAGYDVIKESKAARSQIGYMPESVPLYEEMRVTEYLKFRGRLRGLRGARLQERMEDVLEQCGLTVMRRRVIRALSKGYRQRVGLADALIHDPKLLILDEPTNGLDPNQIRAIRALIKDLAKRRTVLISTHILSEVEMTCNHVIIIDRGQIKAADTPSHLVHSLRATGSVFLEIGADSKPCRGVLETLEHVKRVRVVEEDQKWQKLEITIEAGTDARERISRLVSQHGWTMRSLYRKEANLEDVFVELTRKD